MHRYFEENSPTIYTVKSPPKATGHISAKKAYNAQLFRTATHTWAANPTVFQWTPTRTHLSYIRKKGPNMHSYFAENSAAIYTVNIYFLYVD